MKMEIKAMALALMSALVASCSNADAAIPKDTVEFGAWRIHVPNANLEPVEVEAMAYGPSAVCASWEDNENGTMYTVLTLKRNAASTLLGVLGEHRYQAWEEYIGFDFVLGSELEPMDDIPLVITNIDVYATTPMFSYDVGIDLIGASRAVFGVSVNNTVELGFNGNAYVWEQRSKDRVYIFVVYQSGGVYVDPGIVITKQ